MIWFFCTNSPDDRLISQILIPLFYFSLCFLFHLLLTVSLNSQNFRKKMLLPLFFPPCLFHIPPSDFSLLYFEIVKADNNTPLCKHNYLLYFIKTPKFQINYLCISFVHHRASIMEQLYFFLGSFPVLWLHPLQRRIFLTLNVFFFFLDHIFLFLSGSILDSVFNLAWYLKMYNDIPKCLSFLFYLSQNLVYHLTLMTHCSSFLRHLIMVYLL